MGWNIVKGIAVSVISSLIFFAGMSYGHYHSDTSRRPLNIVVSADADSALIEAMNIALMSELHGVRKADDLKGQALSKFVMWMFVHSQGQPSRLWVPTTFVTQAMVNGQRIEVDYPEMSVHLMDGEYPEGHWMPWQP